MSLYDFLDLCGPIEETATSLVLPGEVMDARERRERRHRRVWRMQVRNVTENTPARIPLLLLEEMDLDVAWYQDRGWEAEDGPWQDLVLPIGEMT